MESGGGQEQSRPLMAEEESLKRNIDCVYFLASPLTCKKIRQCTAVTGFSSNFSPSIPISRRSLPSDLESSEGGDDCSSGLSPAFGLHRGAVG